VPGSPASVWDFLLGDGLTIWLGETTLVLEKDAKWQTDDDISGRIQLYTAGNRLRTTWQPGEWDHDSTLTLTVKAASSDNRAEPGTTIAIQHERLSGRDERRVMLGHWKTVIGQLEDALG
jgi:uncharacterized protein YndB with AHSA1/START domain